MENELQTVFIKLLSEIHKEILKPNGWKKEGQNFRLVLPGSPKSKGILISFQKSQWNDSDQLQFTINACSVYAYRPFTIDPKFRINNNFNYLRPGDISQKYINHNWWSITVDTDYEKLKSEIKEYLVEYAIPYLNPENE